MAMQSQVIDRVFKYGAMTLEDPGIQYSPEQVMAFYANTYAELTNAAVEGPEEKDGKNLYTFRKAVGTKGASDGPVSQGAALITAERLRHLSEEGWTPDHDDAHTDGSLALAGACYASVAANWALHGKPGLDYATFSTSFRWPWDRKWWKPKDPVRDLTRAGALIAAELDRVLRLKGKSRG